MRNNSVSTKGFTLVELIVVIVILAILATIAFLSFSSQSASARDSKRKTDLSNIASKINIGAANGSSLTSFVTTPSKKLTWGTNYLAGTWTSNLTYEAGDINFNQLGVNAGDFKDPLNYTYKMGATTAVGGAFQLASRIENDDNGNTTTSGAFLVGNYTQRKQTSTGTITAISTGSTIKITVSTPLVGFFKTWDTINTWGAANTCVVSSVSSDQSILTVTSCGATPANWDLLKIAAWDEISSLIAWVNSWSGVSNWSNPPY
ncbi:MAG: hypothetical protein ACD_3C00197G0005 [uncultured bacterium (gcode 4)]|uniref:Prepilin-type N-terminal cleavage/methylation domain-containing protein n=1 Tax=uncultured bacterium (gcode 4) TaxID=1234023 RepID=K2F8M5_9BACT|nr:MAG: hypothetical protein ACD_3C00197G0005 [uncultured bacterium (gcode 4)]